jgi:hypothetical protein
VMEIYIQAVVEEDREFHSYNHWSVKNETSLNRPHKASYVICR